MGGWAVGVWAVATGPRPVAARFNRRGHLWTGCADRTRRRRDDLAFAERVHPWTSRWASGLCATVSWPRPAGGGGGPATAPVCACACATRRPTPPWRCQKRRPGPPRARPPAEGPPRPAWQFWGACIPQSPNHRIRASHWARQRSKRGPNQGLVESPTVEKKNRGAWGGRGPPGRAPPAGHPRRCVAHTWRREGMGACGSSGFWSTRLIVCTGGGGEGGLSTRPAAATREGGPPLSPPNPDRFGGRGTNTRRASRGVRLRVACRGGRPVRPSAGDRVGQTVGGNDTSSPARSATRGRLAGPRSGAGMREKKEWRRAQREDHCARLDPRLEDNGLEVGKVSKMGGPRRPCEGHQWELRGGVAGATVL